MICHFSILRASEYEGGLSSFDQALIFESDFITSSYDGGSVDGSIIAELCSVGKLITIVG